MCNVGLLLKDDRKDALIHIRKNIPINFGSFLFELGRRILNLLPFFTDGDIPSMLINEQKWDSELTHEDEKILSVLEIYQNYEREKGHRLSGDIVLSSTRFSLLLARHFFGISDKNIECAFI